MRVREDGFRGVIHGIPGAQAPAGLSRGRHEKVGFCSSGIHGCHIIAALNVVVKEMDDGGSLGTRHVRAIPADHCFFQRLMLAPLFLQYSTANEITITITTVSYCSYYQIWLQEP